MRRTCPASTPRCGARRATRRVASPAGGCLPTRRRRGGPSPAHWGRSAGGQKAPVIIRTRGHRLEGIWHSGSPMQMMLGAIRGIHLLVPRNMTQAAGFYNTMLASDEPAIIVEL